MFQTITYQDGIILYLQGPNVGQRHDFTFYRENDLNDEVSQKFRSTETN